MNYEEFKKELFRVVMQQEEVEGRRVMLLETGYTSEDSQILNMIRYINKVTYGHEDCVMHGDFIQVMWGDDQLCSMMNWNVREYYEKYKKEGWQAVLPELLFKIQKAGHSSDWLQLGKEGYESSKRHLIVRPINYELNKYELENCIYWKYGDIAMTLYGLINDDEEDYVTMKMNRSLTNSWEVSDEKMLREAFSNTCAQMPARLYYCTDLRRHHESWEGCFMQEEGEQSLGGHEPSMIEIHLDSELEGTLGYRLTTTKGINGAIALFYPGVMERIGELLEGDYYVGFTSIHEAIVHPVTHQSSLNMKESICEINRTFPEDEMLTNRVYRYDREQRRLLEV